MILDDIVAKKKKRLSDEMKKISIDGWKEKLNRPGLHRVMDFFGAVKRKGLISIIAEIKKASPSKGLLRENFDPVEIAREYWKSDIQAVSVLTETDFFMGSEEHLVKIRQSLPLPILRKDFIIDIWQIYQSRYLGADAILLIASLLPAGELKKFMAVASILGLHCLVEVHNTEELDRVLEAGARIIGINNRDLNTFEVDLRTTEKLIGRIPYGRAVVSESGIRDAEDLKYLRDLGVDAVLIGETLMHASSISEKIRELRAG